MADWTLWWLLAGAAVEGRPATKSRARCTGERYSVRPPIPNARASYFSCSRIPASTSDAPKSSTGTVTTSPLLANGESRRLRLMPLVAKKPSRDTDGMTYPPAHMQNVNRSCLPLATSE